MTRLQPLEGILTADLTSGGTVEVDDPSLLIGTNQICILSPERQRVEIMTVTGGSGTHASPWTVTRAQRGTTQVDHYKGAKVQGVNFRLVVGSQDYTMRASDLVFTGSSPGGDESLTFSRFIPDPVVVPTLGSAVYLSKSSSTTPGVWTDAGLWTGMLEEPAPHYYPTGGAMMKMNAHGYSQHLSDNPYGSSKILDPATSIPPGLTVARIVKTAIQDQAPLISGDFSHMSAGGQGLQQASGDFLGQTVLGLIGQYTPIGDAFVPNVWHVRGFGDAAPKFELRAKYLTARYKINIEDTVDGVTVMTRRSDVFTTVLVRWHDGIEGWDNTTALASISNVHRGLLVDASSTIANSDDALSLAKTLANMLATIRPRAGEIKITAGKPIYDLFNSLAVVEPWDVIEGNSVIIYKNGSPLDSGNVNVPYSGGFYIRSRRMDFKAGLLTIATSDELAQFAQMITKLTHTELTRQDSSTKMVLGPMWSNPNTPNLPIPTPLPASQRLSKGVDDRVAYEDMAKGAYTKPVPLLFSGGGGTDDPTAIAVGETAGTRLFTPGTIVSAEIYSVAVASDAAPSKVTVHLQKVSAGGATTALFDISLDGTKIRNEVTRVPPDPIAETDTIVGIMTVNDPEDLPSRFCMVTLRWQQRSGEAAKPADTTTPALGLFQANRGGGDGIGATFIFTTTKDCRAYIAYGSSSTRKLSFSRTSPLGKSHTITIPPIPIGTLYFDIILDDAQGHVSTDSGHILF